MGFWGCCRSGASPGGSRAAKSQRETRLKRRRHIPQCTISACCGLSCFQLRQTEGGHYYKYLRESGAATEPRFPLQPGEQVGGIPSPAHSQGHRWSGKQPKPLPGCCGVNPLSLEGIKPLAAHLGAHAGTLWHGDAGSIFLWWGAAQGGLVTVASSWQCQACSSPSCLSLIPASPGLLPLVSMGTQQENTVSSKARAGPAAQTQLPQQGVCLEDPCAWPCPLSPSHSPSPQGDGRGFGQGDGVLEARVGAGGPVQQDGCHNPPGSPARAGGARAAPHRQTLAKAARDQPEGTGRVLTM